MNFSKGEESSKESKRLARYFYDKALYYVNNWYRMSGSEINNESILDTEEATVFKNKQFRIRYINSTYIKSQKQNMRIKLNDSYAEIVNRNGFNYDIKQCNIIFELHTMYNMSKAFEYLAIGQTYTVGFTLNSDIVMIIERIK